MFDTIITIVVHLLTNILVVKLYLDLVLKKSLTPPNKNLLTAEETIQRLENRIAQLQERDGKDQEKIWNLEDQNRVLKGYILELKRDIAAKSTPIVHDIRDDE